MQLENSEINWPYMRYMTKDMLDVLLFRQVIEDELRLCSEKFLEAAKAYKIELPATSACGENVKHGAKTTVMAIADYWQRRGELAMSIICDLNFYNEMRAKYVFK